MRRLFRIPGAARLTMSGLALAGALAVATPALAQDAAQPAQQPQAPKGVTFDGDVAVWMVGIKPDKTADFEAILTKLHDALVKSEKPEHKQQAAGWKIIKLSTQVNGNVAYMHVINPVVKGADYSIMNILYEAFPNDRQALYDAYRGAFGANLSVLAGPVVPDFSK